VLAKLTGAPVVSVECDPELASEIRENAAVNPHLPHISVESLFVGAQDGDGQVTIDTLADRHFMPDVIKLDIEGGEVDALRGAERVLAHRRPAILLEVHGKAIEWECLSILRDAGYDPPSVVERRRWLPERGPLEHNRWLIFPNRPGPDRSS
jgi:hypothetical protein